MDDAAQHILFSGREVSKVMLKIIGNVVGGLLVLVGALFLIGAFDPARGGGFAWMLTGIILIGIGIVLIWFGNRRPKTAAADNVTYKVDLSGDVKLESMKCKSCGGTLTSENIKMVAGAPVVTCPFCGSTYQLTEEPKW
jgi:hypothetical protein